jgi:hypothetical protein
MLNLTVRYDRSLDINGLSVAARTESLRRIFDRDIQENDDFKFIGKVIRPVKIDGQSSLDTVFMHLTTSRKDVEENGRKFSRAEFESQRSIRLHWVRHHIDQGEHKDVHIFSTSERDQIQRKDVLRTYIYNPGKKYVVVLQPQNSELDYYLLSAYYLYEDWGAKSIEKKMKNKLPKVY